MQTADVKEIKNDLKELKNCPGVKERLQEMTETEQRVAKQWDSSELNISGLFFISQFLTSRDERLRDIGLSYSSF